MASIGHFNRGDRVCKTKGDYVFEGVVVARFEKRSGFLRYVVEDDRGLLFIFSQGQLSRAPSPNKDESARAKLAEEE